MPSVQIFLPVSRSQHVQPLFNSLEALECDPATTSLLVYVDGDKSLYDAVSPLVSGSKFNQPQCIHRPQDPKQKISKNSTDDRRKRIAAIWNEARDLIGPCKYVMGIEDDTIVPSHSLERLLDGYGHHPYAGLIEGAELGRWGITHVGGWRADDVYEPTHIQSAVPFDAVKPGLESRDQTTTEEIDAGGFYCYLTKREHFVGHEYKPYGHILGPDFDYGLSLRQQGYKNYIDWSVRCTHLLDDGRKLTLRNSTIQRFTLTKKEGRWRQKIR